MIDNTFGPSLDHPPARLIQEALEDAAERNAILVIVMRQLATANHRRHVGNMSWANCPHPICRKAHAAIEGHLLLGEPHQGGQINTVVYIGETA